MRQQFDADISDRDHPDRVSLRSRRKHKAWGASPRPNEEIKFAEQQRKFLNLSYSIGLIVSTDGVVLDVNPDLAAAKSGLAPGMKIVGINGRSWSTETLHDAIAATKDGSGSIELRVENGGFQETYKVAYHGGERYPHLERDAGAANLLDDIIRPRAH
jgi:predicted metalloprotease with PDZ domain